MKPIHNTSSLLFVGLILSCLVLSCAGSQKKSQNAESDDSIERILTVEDTARVPVPGDPDYEFENEDSIRNYLENNPEATGYSGGILPVIAEEVPEYANKLIGNPHDGFLVVDKASMRVILYDRYGQEVKAYDMACAKNYGTKHKKADSRTPEGFFSVEGIYDSTDWLYTDDNGKQSKVKGQFGPRFIRIKIPTTSQIGIHGTCAPWSIGHRASHGCIRLTNDNILELVELVEPGMPVIILPGRRDRLKNAEEGYFTPYFPTAPKYAVKSTEHGELEKARRRALAEKEMELSPDSMKSEKTEPETTVVSDTIVKPSDESPISTEEKGE